MSLDPGLAEKLAAILGDGGLLTDAEAMAPYVREWRGHFASAAMAVARPADTQAVARTVAACAQAGVAMIPQGGNTGLVGGSVARPDQIIVSLERMTAVRAVDTDNDSITVEAGCILADVQAAAAAAGRLFPLSLAAEGSCRIGGNLATNAGGVNVLHYGNTRDLTLGLEVVLADGRVWQNLRGLRKDNAGLDLAQWFIGSEGALGIITAAVCKLFAPPVQLETAFIAVADPAAAVGLLRQLRADSGDHVIACELLPAFALDLVCRHIPGCRNPLEGDHPWYLLAELASPAGGTWLREGLERCLQRGLETASVRDAAIAADLAQRRALWRLRESIPEAQSREGASIKHDISVPVSAIPALLDEATAAIRQAVPGVRVCAFGHVGDGNLHFNLSQPRAGDGKAFLATTGQCKRIVHDLVAAMGGSIAAEHGIGRLKPAELLRYKPQVEMDLMRRIKDALDPQGLLNPGALLGTGDGRNSAPAGGSKAL